MSEKVQGRNILDVAMELTNIHLERHVVDSADDLKRVYAEYYSLAKALGGKSGKSLRVFLPEEIKEKIKE